MNATTIEAEHRRDKALNLVSAHRSAQIWAAQLAMLQAMRSRPDLSGTSDDMTPAGVEHAGNAPWLGAAVRQLSIGGLIVRAGTVVSKRPSRHANEIKLWKLADIVAADAQIVHLQKLLAAITPVSAGPCPTGLFNESRGVR